VVPDGLAFFRCVSMAVHWRLTWRTGTSLLVSDNFLVLPSSRPSGGDPPSSPAPCDYQTRTTAANELFTIHSSVNPPRTWLMIPCFSGLRSKYLLARIYSHSGPAHSLKFFPLGSRFENSDHDRDSCNGIIVPYCLRNSASGRSALIVL
jgi:hypothetical protein